MDLAKATINVKDGTIQLEGPKEFVEKYLDLFSPMIKGVSLTKQEIPQKKDEISENEPGEIKRKRNVGARSGPSCAERILGLKDENFFTQPRSSTEVRDQLKLKGWTYETKNVAASLLNLNKAGRLRRVQEGSKFNYCNP